MPKHLNLSFIYSDVAIPRERLNTTAVFCNKISNRESSMETWKSVKDNDNYQVSNYGRVRNVIRSSRILTPSNNGNGYLRVDLYRNGTRQKHFVHRLVAKAFLPNTKDLPEVNHIDHIRTNNALDNLEWVTSSENHYKRYSHKRNNTTQ